MAKSKQLETVDLAPAPVSEGAAYLAMIERAAANPEVDVEKMRALLEIKKDVMAVEAAQLYSVAMNAAQGEMFTISQDGSNPQTSSKYATYAKLDSACRPIYIKHGFSVEFDTVPGALADHVRVVAEISHTGGHTKTRMLDMPIVCVGPQGKAVMTPTHATASAVSYAKRGLLKMSFNLAEGADTDDDGNAAGNLKINTEQLARIVELATDVKADVEKFCRIFKVADLASLPAMKFTEAMDVLESTRGKK